MNTKLLRSYYIWFILAAGLVVRFMVMLITGNMFDDPFLGGIALFSNLSIGYVIYRVGNKAEGGSEPSPSAALPLILAAFWVFNPAAIFASTAGDFYEPVIVLAMILLIGWVRHKVYGTSVIVFLPALLQLRFWLQNINYASSGALNFFALVGGFRQPAETLFWGFRFSTYGMLFIVLIIVGAILALNADREQGSNNFYLITAGYFTLLFMFAHNMQPASLFPVPVLLILHFSDRHAAAKSRPEGIPAKHSIKGNRNVVLLYIAFSATFFTNMRMANISEYTFFFSHMSDGMILVSIVNALLMLALVYILVNTVWPKFKLFSPPDEAGERQGIPVKYYIFILLAVGFIVRVMSIVHIDYMFGFDVWVFKSWANILNEYGFAYFYGHPYPAMTDYPPVYLYVLYVIGRVAARFEWENFHSAYTFVIFLPAILCDLGIGYVLHRRAEKTQRPLSRVNLPIILAALWILNPAVILISSVWGQVESVFTLILLLSLLLLRDKKLLPAYMLYGIAILTKPQSLFLGPVYLYSAIEYLQDAKFSVKDVARLVGYILAPVAMMLLLFVPFGLRTGIQFFFEGLGFRQYGTINAFNFFHLIGGNFRALDTRFMGMTYGFIGMAVVIIVIFGTIAVLFVDRKHGGKHYFLIVGALFALLYVFAFRMLDRYFFPALPFLLLHAIERRDRRVLALFVGFSAMFYFNCFEMLRWVRHGEIRSYVARSISAGNVILGCILVYVVVQSIWQRVASEPEGESITTDHGY